ncbi:DUF397 domain-containing protein [Streptomyces sp. NPDC101455]|uniref:DUF397 domain-containing protein n=1 Tax=Streptomyces sp. NPDC101455 TaxID=3366142 RepID=UPI0038178936
MDSPTGFFYLGTEARLNKYRMLLDIAERSSLSEAESRQLNPPHCPRTLRGPALSVQRQKSSFSGVEGGNCLELAHHEGRILLRESETPGDVLALPPERVWALMRHCGLRS